MGKFKAHVLFLAFVLMPLLCAFGFHVRALALCPFFAGLQLYRNVRYEPWSDCQPQRAVAPWIKPVEYKFKQGG